MRLHLVSVGNKMPHWVSDGYLEYAKRLPDECSLHLVEILPSRRYKGSDINRITKDEGERQISAIPKGARIIALDVKGKSWSTEYLSSLLSEWMQDGRDVAFLIGGPDGLSDQCLTVADQRWSLSALTFPHPLVRVILAEQIYRAWSLLRNHPYHRA